MAEPIYTKNTTNTTNPEQIDVKEMSDGEQLWKLHDEFIENFYNPKLEIEDATDNFYSKLSKLVETNYKHPTLTLTMHNMWPKTNAFQYEDNNQFNVPIWLTLDEDSMTKINDIIKSNSSNKIKDIYKIVKHYYRFKILKETLVSPQTSLEQQNMSELYLRTLEIKNDNTDKANQTVQLSLIYDKLARIVFNTIKTTGLNNFVLKPFVLEEGKQEFTKIDPTKEIPIFNPITDKIQKEFETIKTKAPENLETELKEFYNLSDESQSNENSWWKTNWTNIWNKNVFKERSKAYLVTFEKNTSKEQNLRNIHKRFINVMYNNENDKKIILEAHTQYFRDLIKEVQSNIPKDKPNSIKIYNLNAKDNTQSFEYVNNDTFYIPVFNQNNNQIEELPKENFNGKITKFYETLEKKEKREINNYYDDPDPNSRKGILPLLVSDEVRVENVKIIVTPEKPNKEINPDPIKYNTDKINVNNVNITIPNSPQPVNSPQPDSLQPVNSPQLVKSPQPDSPQLVKSPQPVNNSNPQVISPQPVNNSPHSTNDHNQILQKYAATSNIKTVKLELVMLMLTNLEKDTEFENIIKSFIQNNTSK